jgi:hypothetical protein
MEPGNYGGSPDTVLQCYCPTDILVMEVLITSTSWTVAQVVSFTPLDCRGTYSGVSLLHHFVSFDMSRMNIEMLLSNLCYRPTVLIHNRSKLKTDT